MIHFLKNKTGNGSHSASVFLVSFSSFSLTLALARPQVFFIGKFGSFKSQTSQRNSPPVRSDNTKGLLHTKKQALDHCSSLSKVRKPIRYLLTWR